MDTIGNQEEERRMSFTKRSLLFVAVLLVAFLIEAGFSIGSFFSGSERKSEDKLRALLDSFIVATKNELLLNDMVKKDSVAVEPSDTVNLDKTL